MKKSGIVLISLIILTLTGCEFEESNLIFTTADVIGYVDLYDEFGINVADSDVKVYVYNRPGTSVFTDEDGLFIIPDVTPDNLQLVFEKDGFGSYVASGIDHVDMDGPTKLEDTVILSEKSTTTIEDIWIYPLIEEIRISVRIEPPGSARYPRTVRYFVHKDSLVSDRNYLKTHTLVTKSEFTVLSSDSLGWSYWSDSTFYVIAYGDAYYDCSYYPYGREWPEDTYTRYPNLNPKGSEVVKFVMP